VAMWKCTLSCIRFRDCEAGSYGVAVSILRKELTVQTATGPRLPRLVLVPCDQGVSSWSETELNID
jgi:hypothetical protein